MSSLERSTLTFLRLQNFATWRLLHMMALASVGLIPEKSLIHACWSHDSYKSYGMLTLCTLHIVLLGLTLPDSHDSQDQVLGLLRSIYTSALITHL